MLVNLKINTITDYTKLVWRLGLVVLVSPLSNQKMSRGALGQAGSDWLSAHAGQVFQIQNHLAGDPVGLAGHQREPHVRRGRGACHG